MCMRTCFRVKNEYYCGDKSPCPIVIAKASPVFTADKHWCLFWCARRWRPGIKFSRTYVTTKL